VPKPGQLDQRLGHDGARLDGEVCERLVGRVELPQGLDVRAVVKGVGLGAAGVPHRVEAFARR
jgi:hypothetical protein